MTHAQAFWRPIDEAFGEAYARIAPLAARPDVRSLLVHLTASHRGYRQLTRLVREGQYDLDRARAQQVEGWQESQLARYAARSPGDLLQEWCGWHEELRAELDALDDRLLPTVVYRPDLGDVTLERFLDDIPRHVRAHIAQISPSSREAAR